MSIHLSIHKLLVLFLGLFWLGTQVFSGPLDAYDPSIYP